MMSLLGAMGCHRWTPPPLQEQPFPAVCSSTPTVRFFPVSLWTASGVEVLFALVEGFSDTLVTAPVAAYVDGLHEQPTAVATLTGEGVETLVSEPALGMGVPGCGWEVVARLTMPVETARGYGQYVDRELEIVVSTPNGSVVADETYPVRVLLPYADLYDTGASNP